MASKAVCFINCVASIVSIKNLLVASDTPEVTENTRNESSLEGFYYSGLTPKLNVYNIYRD
jgi:hypothetical protein